MSALVIWIDLQAIFAFANANQEKDLEKFLINIRWKPPILNNQELISQIDNFNFDSDKITQALPGYQENLEGIKDGNQENATFKIKDKGKGAPKKEKRMKSFTKNFMIL